MKRIELHEIQALSYPTQIDDDDFEDCRCEELEEELDEYRKLAESDQKTINQWKKKVGKNVQCAWENKKLRTALKEALSETKKYTNLSQDSDIKSDTDLCQKSDKTSSLVDKCACSNQTKTYKNVDNHRGSCKAVAESATSEVCECEDWTEVDLKRDAEYGQWIHCPWCGRLIKE